MGKQSKLRRKRRQGERKPVRSPEPVRVDPFRRPYDSEEEFRADCDLTEDAWAKHYPVDERSEDFIAPLIEHDLAGPRPAEWIGTFRALMTEKYGNTEQAELRTRFILETMSESYLDRVWETLGLGTELA